MRLFTRVLLTALACISFLPIWLAQGVTLNPKAGAMPADRISDSFQIYSMLIPVGETANEGWPHDLWLVADATIEAVESNLPCETSPQDDPLKNRRFFQVLSPHLAIEFPDEYLLDGREIVADFNAHCHERWKLDSGSWSLKQPVHLLSPAEQEEFKTTKNSKSAPPEILKKYKGAPALYAFSGVYFNHNHRVAVVYVTQWCGGLCGEGFWVAFTNDGTGWVEQDWRSDHWMS